MARPDHPEIAEVVATAHCVQRFRARRGIRTPGFEPLAQQLEEALREADFTRWPPAWVDTNRHTEMWALHGEIAFPLASTPQPGRWLATTCLVRGMRG